MIQIYLKVSQIWYSDNSSKLKNNLSSFNKGFSITTTETGLDLKSFDDVINCYNDIFFCAVKSTENFLEGICPTKLIALTRTECQPEHLSGN